METIYGFLVRQRSSIKEGLIMYAAAMMANIYSEKHTSLSDFFTALFDVESFSAVTMWIALGIFIIFLIVFRLLQNYHSRHSKGYKLRYDMLSSSNPCFTKVQDRNGYEWGDDRTIVVCDNLFEGWKPENIIVEKVQSNKFEFSGNEVNKQKEFADFMETDGANQVISRGNNNERWMVSSYTSNFNKQDKKLFLSLQKTEWLMNRYFWTSYKNNREKQSDYMWDLYNQKKIMPNSFCLHLVLITNDDEVVMTAVSNNKSNDYPMTWAATIGEQVEGTDFNNGVDIKSDFIVNWTKRALSEEFGIYEEQYNRIIGRDDLRVLSLDAEGDIYNISLLTVAHMNVSFEEFMTEVGMHPEKDKEFTEIKPLKIKDIPHEIAIRWEYGETGDYHPSTFLRLFMSYIHRYGINTFVSHYESEKKKIKNS